MTRPAAPPEDLDPILQPVRAALAGGAQPVVGTDVALPGWPAGSREFPGTPPAGNFRSARCDRDER